jgi:hypothetical protein
MRLRQAIEAHAWQYRVLDVLYMEDTGRAMPLLLCLLENYATPVLLLLSMRPMLASNVVAGQQGGFVDSGSTTGLEARHCPPGGGTSRLGKVVHPGW